VNYIGIILDHTLKDGTHPTDFSLSFRPAREWIVHAFDALGCPCIFPADLGESFSSAEIFSQKIRELAEDRGVILTYGVFPLLTAETLQEAIDLCQEECRPIGIDTDEDIPAFAAVFPPDWEGSFANPFAEILCQPEEDIPVYPTAYLALRNAAKERILLQHLAAGVDILSGDGVMIEPGVLIGKGAQIFPGTILRGKTVIGEGCVIGPNSTITDSVVGAGSKILSSVLTQSTVGENTTIGPFTQLRPNSVVGNRVKIGDFVEIKNSTIGDETSVAHLTYVGDSDVGRKVNFGCGVVTVNYDGAKKHRTTIGDYAFIGCNTNLVSPVAIGENAYTAAGTTITEDIPDDSLAIGRPRLEVKKDWVLKRLGKRRYQAPTE